MKLLIFAFALLAVAFVSSTSEDEYDVKFAKIREDAEKYYETISDNVIEDSKLTVPEIIKKYGYPAEIHTVETEDGHILELHRIPYGKSGPSEGRPAVLLQHGILMSSADWIIAGPEKGFAYILADEGYDVWIPNARGTRYSKKHKVLHPKDDAAEFWNFSWHEIAMHDVASKIDYVIAATKQPKIFYVGHSQGTTVFYVLCSEKPEYNNKIRAMMSLAPIGFMKRIKSPVMRYGAMIEPVFSLVAKWFGIHEFMPHSEVIGTVGNSLCGDSSIFQILCTNSLFAIVGFNKANMNATLLPIIMAHTPAGTSTKQILHYAQEINSGYFRKYDHGMIKNKRVYGSWSPPNYNLKNIKVQIDFFYSKNDWMAHPKDVTKLYKKLPKTRSKHVISDKKFNHADFLFGMNAKKVLYTKVLKKMKKYW